jgi:hypothetical protein
MTSQNKKAGRRPRSEAFNPCDPAEMLDDLLALDRMLIEVSMRLYKVPQRERFTMRAQNRRLHDVVRQHLPRLLKPSRSQF